MYWRGRIRVCSTTCVMAVGLPGSSQNFYVFFVKTCEPSSKNNQIKFNLIFNSSKFLSFLSYLQFLLIIFMTWNQWIGALKPFFYLTQVPSLKIKNPTVALEREGLPLMGVFLSPNWWPFFSLSIKPSFPMSAYPWLILHHRDVVSSSNNSDGDGPLTT